MAIARCERCDKPEGRDGGYVASHLPVGHPESGVVCGKAECENTAIMWLKEPEEKLYKKGKRVFEIHTRTAKVRVQ